MERLFKAYFILGILIVLNALGLKLMQVVFNLVEEVGLYWAALGEMDI